MRWLTDMAMGITAAALIILILKGIFRDKMSERMHVGIWGILLLRLAAPFFPQSSLPFFHPMALSGFLSGKSDADIGSVSEKEAGAEALTEGGFFQSIENFFTGHTENRLPAKMSQKGAEDVQAAGFTGDGNGTASFSAGDILFFIWIAGVAALLFCIIFSSVRYSAKLKKEGSRPSAELIKMLEECRQTIGVRRKVGLICTNHAPMVQGIVRPVIFLPDGYSKEENRNIFLHELCHCKNGDLLMIYGAVLLLCLNWFHPLMWYCYFVFRRDVEIYCDRRVLQFVDSRKDYAKLLLKTSEGKRGILSGAVSYQNGEKEVKRRIRRMARMTKPKMIWSAAVIIFVLAAGAFCFANGMRQDQPKDAADGALQTLSVQTEANMVCSTVSSNGEDIFYALAEPIPQGNSDKRVQIVKADPKSKKTEVIYETADRDGFHLSELCAAEDFIAWETVKGQHLTINKMDLKTSEIDTVYTSDSPEIPLLLSAYENYIIWYDLSGTEAKLCILDTETGKVKKIEKIRVNSPYERVPVNDGFLAFLSSEDCGPGRQKVVIYNLEEGSEVKNIIVEEALPLQRLSADERYVTYMLLEQDTNNSLYAYDYQKDRAIQLNEKDGMYIFSYRLINGKVFINEKTSNHVIAMDIESGEKENLTESLEGKHAFYLDGNYGKFISGRDTTKKPVNKRFDSHAATYLLQNQEALTDK